jgi:hypothetical protein
MATQATFPPSQWRIQGLSQREMVKSGGFRQIHYLDAGTKLMCAPWRVVI